ncbi:TonB family protein [Thalassotalea sp. G2M2-11]|uniref:TonB family protein n=1 Tax=Thalassotalea sp. G2M2-11 TaxID=2787627 RepID=UPI0019D1A651|nr:TonB family protein [Thalassotalea sp. G2M2-11]
MKFFFRILFLLCFLPNFSANADLLSATSFYNKGEYQKAINEFKRLAKLGNKDAIYNIGVMYLHGQGVKENLFNAHSWFQLAADFGVEDAKSATQLIAQKINQPQQLESGYLALNEHYGFERYQKNLLPVFNQRPFQKSNQPPRRIHTVDAKYPKSAYEKGIEGWVWLEFDIDESGAVKDVDIIDAFPDKTFNRAIYNAVRRWRYEPYRVDGKAQAFTSRSLLYHFTTFKGERYQASFADQKKEYQIKINRLIDAAEQGNALIQYYIANWMNTDEHNATRLLKFHWQQATASSDLLLASAENGFPNSQYRLGANLLRGKYTRADREKGLNWILNAAQSGFVFAQYRLARELLDKRTIQYDVDKAKRWLTMAADKGHFRSQRDLVELLLSEKNWPLAQQYLTKALQLDEEHPDLLLSQAKLKLVENDQAAAQRLVNKAITEAEQRQWSIKKLTEFLHQIS